MYKSLIIFLLLSFQLFAVPNADNTLKGFVLDKYSGEPLVGANIRIDKSNVYVLTGLDGSFSLKHLETRKYLLIISHITYQSFKQEVVINSPSQTLMIKLENSRLQELDEVQVVATTDKSSENSARKSERNANQLMNIVSAKAIEISPDLTVANLIQRVSGVSIERNSNGDGQYAILRGMDKRYNYTLVNGIKIPSPDNKYRYVPLDIFPSELLSRLEVTKTLTPNLEGDAIGGMVNMVMKDAPTVLEIKANLAFGYNELFLNGGFSSFNKGQVLSKSSYEINGTSYYATPNDFSKATVAIKTQMPSPNIVGGLSIGNRYVHNKLGVILALSYQNTNRGSNSSFNSSTVYDTERSSRITSISERKFADQQERLGIHLKLDYRLNAKHKFQWYNAFMNLQNSQVRETRTTDFSNGGYDPIVGNAGLSFATRARLTQQQIMNSTLQGNHKLLDKLTLDWSVVYSIATNATPDNTSITVLGTRKNFVETKTYASQMTRRWEHNSDNDYAAYLNLVYLTKYHTNTLELSTGGLYRNKKRDNFYNNYQFQPSNVYALYGKDFNANEDLSWTLNNPRGSVASALTYKATEQIIAEYFMAKLQQEKLQTIAGLRLEHTNQGYEMLFPLGESKPSGNQIYTDFLPSVNIKYILNTKQVMRASYFRSINRPGFFEIVPGKVVNEEYQERGNPDLKRAIADNFDIRFELLPNPSDQLLIGVFYKFIKDPIEYALNVDETRGQDVYYSPGNYGNATNFGLELDYIKYIKNWGIKANYTYTNSLITTQKIIRDRNSNGELYTKNVAQTRPLYGQSAHIGNVTLLYKDGKTGWDAQLAASYTGERINTVSQFLDNDLWQEAFIQMDASVEKKIGTDWVIFAKANNLIDTPLRVVIKNTNPVNNDINLESGNAHSTLIRQDFYKRSFVLGVRFKI